MTTVRPAEAISRRHRRRLLVETGMRLIEKKDIGLMKDCTTDRQALLHPAREFTHQIPPARGETDEMQHIIDPPLEITYAIHPTVKAEVLLSGKITVQ